MKAILRRVRISPKKANLVAALVRNKKVDDAVDILEFTPKKAAPILKKLINSAAANAVNNKKQDRTNLYIKEIIVTEGPTYKRSIPVSRGRSHRLLKRTSHITVLTEIRESQAIKKPAIKKENKEAKETKEAQPINESEKESKTTKKQ